MKNNKNIHKHMKERTGEYIGQLFLQQTLKGIKVQIYSETREMLCLCWNTMRSIKFTIANMIESEIAFSKQFFSSAIRKVNACDHKFQCRIPIFYAIKHQFLNQFPEENEIRFIIGNWFRDWFVIEELNKEQDL